MIMRLMFKVMNCNFHEIPCAMRPMIMIELNE